jgi:HD-GYP domain-containing protein (c-di-GMP phosphodiesterase class II)
MATATENAIREFAADQSKGADGLRIKELEEQQRSLMNSVICGFNQLLDLRDLGTGVHSTRLAEWAVRVGRKLGIEEIDLHQLEVAALLHDIGKIGIPDSILKKEGKLTDEERALMNKHPEYSWSILRLFPGLDKASLYALHHHESYNGRGYPGGLKAGEIPIGSRIVAVIDAYDAMISNRCYRKGFPHEEAVRRLVADSGAQFDPIVVQAFVEIAGQEVADVFLATGTSSSAVIYTFVLLFAIGSCAAGAVARGFCAAACKRGTSARSTQHFWRDTTREGARQPRTLLLRLLLRGDHDHKHDRQI